MSMTNIGVHYNRPCQKLETLFLSELELNPYRKSKSSERDVNSRRKKRTCSVMRIKIIPIFMVPTTKNCKYLKLSICRQSINELSIKEKRIMLKCEIEE
jgi:hypothetical protein